MEKISENDLSLKRLVGLQIAQAVKEGHLPLSIKLKFLPVRPGNYAPRNLCDSDGGAGMCASGGRAAELTGPRRAVGHGPARMRVRLCRGIGQGRKQRGRDPSHVKSQKGARGGPRERHRASGGPGDGWRAVAPRGTEIVKGLSCLPR